MPIAAAPHYLGADFSTASAGQRFGMYLELWGVDSRTKQPLWTTYDINYRTKRDENKTHAIKQATSLTPCDKAAMIALTTRQRTIADTIPDQNRLTCFAQAVAPFTTGLGHEHPLENGFAFLNPYGLPYLPGSGIKGVVRRAAQELASGDWGCSAGWSNTRDYAFKEEGKASLDLSMIDLLFGREPPSGDQRQFRGVLTFWDAVPQIEGDRLQVEIMTPHQGHYYQQGKSQQVESPHDSGQPNPISFLTVPLGTGFTFHVTCNRERLERLAPKLAPKLVQNDLWQNDLWRTSIKSAFTHAFEWLGFGAKTAVGYGAMRLDPRAEEEEARRQEALRAQQEKERQQREAEEAEIARRQAEQAAFDALPESRKRLIEFRRSVDAISPDRRIDETRRNELNAQANRLAKEAPGWSDAGEREEAAGLLERLYGKIGWSSGKKRNQREKQETKRRNAIKRIRDV